MVTTEQTRQFVRELSTDSARLRAQAVESIRQSYAASVTAGQEIGNLISMNSQLLIRGRITTVQFANNEHVDIRFAADWFSSTKLLLQAVEAFPELASIQETWMLRSLLDKLSQWLAAREKSQGATEAFAANHPIPETWNAELVERNMVAAAKGEAIDARDYIASLPR